MVVKHYPNTSTKWSFGKKKSIILNKSRTMLLEGKVSIYLCIETVHNIVYLVNSSSTKVNEGWTPYKILT